ncbi:hypothetical protein CYMTET_27619, partial [Cymbomonas tetramitiformis]
MSDTTSSQREVFESDSRSLHFTIPYSQDRRMVRPTQLLWASTSVALVVKRGGPGSLVISSLLLVHGLLAEAVTFIEKLRLLYKDVVASGVFARLEAKRAQVHEEIRQKKEAVEADIQEIREVTPSPPRKQKPSEIVRLRSAETPPSGKKKKTWRRGWRWYKPWSWRSYKNSERFDRVPPLPSEHRKSWDENLEKYNTRVRRRVNFGENCSTPPPHSMGAPKASGSSAQSVGVPNGFDAAQPNTQGGPAEREFPRPLRRLSQIMTSVRPLANKIGGGAGEDSTSSSDATAGTDAPTSSKQRRNTIGGGLSLDIPRTPATPAKGTADTVDTPVTEKEDFPLSPTNPGNRRRSWMGMGLGAGIGESALTSGRQLAAAVPPRTPAAPVRKYPPAIMQIVELVRYSLLTVTELHEVVKIESVQRVLPDLSKKGKKAADAPQVGADGSLVLSPLESSRPAEGPNPLAQVTKISESIQKAVSDLRQTADHLAKLDKTMETRLRTLNIPK